MERVTDELISYIEQNALLDAAREAVNRRLNLDARSSLNVVHGTRWRFERWPWRDRAEELYVDYPSKTLTGARMRGTLPQHVPARCVGEASPRG